MTLVNVNNYDKFENYGNTPVKWAITFQITTMLEHGNYDESSPRNTNISIALITLFDYFESSLLNSNINSNVYMLNYYHIIVF